MPFFELPPRVAADLLGLMQTSVPFRLSWLHDIKNALQAMAKRDRD